MSLNKTQLEQVNQSNFPNNNQQLITPEKLREFNTDMIEAMVINDSTASFAKTNEANTFTASQTIAGNLTVTGTISASVIHTQIETASVIYSSGSNQFGDELTDVQTLSGSVLIQGSLLVNGQPIFTGSVNTDGLVTTSSFNAYTASTNAEISALEANTASVNASISNLNVFTQSANISIGALNAFTQSQAQLNGTFATTGSNTFTGNQVIDRANKLYTNGIYWTDPTAGYNNLEIINQGGGNLDFASLNGGRMRVVSTPILLTGSVLTSYNDISTSANIYAANLTGSTIDTGSFATTGSNTFYGTQYISGNVLPLIDGQGDLGNELAKWNSVVVNGQIKGSSVNASGRSFLGTIRLSDENFPLSFLAEREIVGDGSGADTHMYYGTGSAVDALREFVYAQSGSNADFTAVSASFNSRINSITGSGGTINTGSFATTGSNTFIGNQTIGGNVALTGSSPVDISFTKPSGTESLRVGVQPFNPDTWEIAVTGSSIQQTMWLIDNRGGVRYNTFPAPVISIGTFEVENTFTASLQQGYVWVGNASGKTSAVPTSSFVGGSGSIDTSRFATTGSNSFVGDQTITGSLIVSGSTAVFRTTGSVDFYPGTSINFYGNTNFTNALRAPIVNVDASGSGYYGFNNEVYGRIYQDFSGSVDSRINAISPVATGSLLITASAAGSDITFTKGDGSTFVVTVATGSVVSSSYAETSSLAINAKDIIVDVKNTTGAQLNKGTVVRIIGATGDNPLIGTASWTDDNNSANTLGFVVSDIPNDTFGRVMTQGTLLAVNTDPALGYAAGDLVYLSSSGQFTNVKPPAPYHEVRLGQVLRAQQNNGSIYVLIQNGYELGELHDVDINTGSLANKDILAYDSASGQWENWTINGLGIAITGSNVFTGSQTITTDGNTDLIISSSNPSGQANLYFRAFQGNMQSTGNFQFGNSGQFGGSGSVGFFASNNSIQLGADSGIRIGATNGGGNGIDAGAISLQTRSGSLSLAPAGQTNTTASLSHLSASSNTSLVNLVFKPNTNTGTTIISGSGNIFTNPAAPTAGRVNYIGGSGNMFLNAAVQQLPQITGSAASVSGNRPTMNGNLIVGAHQWTILQPPNPGAHTYNNNMFIGATTHTFNFLGNTTPTINISNNMTVNGALNLNSPSRSVAEINAGATGSNSIGMGGNGLYAGTINYNGPVSSSTHNINSNQVIGGTFNFNAQSSSRAMNATSNLVVGSLTFNDNTVFAPTLGSTNTITNNIVNGNFTLTNSASASIAATNNNINALTVTNLYDASAVSTAGARSLNIANNAAFGALMNLYTSGSSTGAVTGRFFGGNLLAGLNISASIVGDGNLNMAGTAVLGRGLNVYGTSPYTSIASQPEHIGSLFAGRWNAEDGNRAKTAETVFAVGTGTSGSVGIVRKTAFLIDSGSNTFVEGTLNVSGSSTFNGNTTITGSLILSSSAAIELNVIGNVSVTGSINVNSGSFNGQAITNITPVSSSLSPILNIVTMTSAEYALITPNSQTLYVIV